MRDRIAQKHKWFNCIVIIAVVIALAFWTWWLFRPTEGTFTLQARWKVQGYIFGGVAFSPRSDLLAVNVLTPKSELTVTLWRIPKARQVKVIIVDPTADEKIFCRPPTFSPDGRLLALSYFDQGVAKVSIFSLPEGYRVRTIVLGKVGIAPSAAFSPDGKRLVIGHDSGLWIIWLTDWKKIFKSTFAANFAFSPDAKLIASDAWKTIGIYDLNGNLVRRLNMPPTHTVKSIAFTPDGQRLMCVVAKVQFKGKQIQWRDQLFVWRTKDWQLERSLILKHFHASEFLNLSAAFSHDSSLIALEESPHSRWTYLWWRVRQWSNRSLALKPFIPPLPTQVVVRRTSDGQVVTTLQRFGRRVTDCAFSPDDHYLAVVHDGKIITLWERR